MNYIEYFQSALISKTGFEGGLDDYIHGNSSETKEINMAQKIGAPRGHQKGRLAILQRENLTST